MGKAGGALVLCSLVIAFPIISGIAQGPEEVECWFKALGRAKEKVTKLHFYFHDTVSGKSPTALQVAQSNISLTSPTFFGLINMADDPLTVGPEPSSQIVGRGQGFYASADLHEVGFLMNMNFVFAEGNYKGSSLSLLGRNSVRHNYREMSIVGGTGVFRLARGIATAKTYYVNPSTGDAIVEYSVVVLHY